MPSAWARSARPASPEGNRSGVGGPRAQSRLEIRIARRAGPDIPPRVDDEQLDAEGGGPVDFVVQDPFGDGRAVGEPRVIGHERLEGSAVAKARQHELAQRARHGGRGARRHAEESMRELDGAIEGNRRGQSLERGGHPESVVQPFDTHVPGAGPHQATEEFVCSVVDRHQRDELLRRAGIGAEVEALAWIQVAAYAGERVLVIGRQPAQSGQRVHGRHRHGDLPRHQIGEAGGCAGTCRLDARPGFDGGRARIAGVDARDEDAGAAIFEREGEPDAVVCLFGLGVDEGEARPALAQDLALCPCRQADIRGRGHIPRTAGDRVGDALEGKRARRVESDAHVEITAANRPAIAGAVVSDERITVGDQDRGHCAHGTPWRHGNQRQEEDEPGAQTMSARRDGMKVAGRQASHHYRA